MVVPKGLSSTPKVGYYLLHGLGTVVLTVNDLTAPCWYICLSWLHDVAGVVREKASENYWLWPFEARTGES